MKILTCAAAAVAAALLVVAPGTAREGRAVPRSARRLGRRRRPRAALSATSRFPGAARRRSPACASATGACSASPRFAGVLGIPQVTWDGTTDGISANGQRLVLASITSRPLGAPDDLRRPAGEHARGRQRRIELPGHWVFDAISPDGSTIYAVQYADLSHYSVRAIDAVSGRVHRGADRRQARARRGDARLADDARLGARPAWAYTLYAKPERHGVRPRARHEAPRSRSASTFPGTGSETGSARSGCRSAPMGARSCCASPASGRSPRSISAASR